MEKSTRSYDVTLFLRERKLNFHHVEVSWYSDLHAHNPYVILKSAWYKHTGNRGIIPVSENVLQLLEADGRNIETLCNIAFEHQRDEEEYYADMARMDADYKSDRGGFA